MKTETILVKAKLTLYHAERSSRKTPIHSGYRPNHVFEYDKNGSFRQTYIGQITFEKDELIQLGKTKNVTVEFLKLFDIDKYLTVGRKWWIHEAKYVIGEAEIIDII